MVDAEEVVTVEEAEVEDEAVLAAWRTGTTAITTMAPMIPTEIPGPDTINIMERMATPAGEVSNIEVTTVGLEEAVSPREMLSGSTMRGPARLTVRLRTVPLCRLIYNHNITIICSTFHR